MDTLILVFFAGMLAGAMNALAGGGSLVGLPVLIAAGVPPMEANASSTVALFPGGLVSAWVYREGLASIGKAPLGALLVSTLCGGWVGAIFFLWKPSAMSTVVLPWLLLLAFVALAFGRRLNQALRARWNVHAYAVLATQFALGAYGGYFSGAVGILMIAVWGLLDNHDLKHLSSPRTLLASAANVAVVLALIGTSAVHWPVTLTMLVGAIIGGYGGAHIGRCARPGVVHAITMLGAFCVKLAFFVNTYVPALLRH